MAYAQTDAAETKRLGNRTHRGHVIGETEAGSASEYTIEVPQFGRLSMLSWSLTNVGVGSSTTMRPTLRTATGGWVSSGAGLTSNVYRPGSAAANGSENPDVYYYAPNGLLYVRGGYDNAAADASGETVIVTVEGHVS